MINLSFNLLKNKIIGNRSRLGIYFGKDRISAVEITGSHILKTASLNLPKLPPALDFRIPVWTGFECLGRGHQRFY